MGTLPREKTVSSAKKGCFRYPISGESRSDWSWKRYQSTLNQLCVRNPKVIPL